MLAGQRTAISKGYISIFVVRLVESRFVANWFFTSIYSPSYCALVSRWIFLTCFIVVCWILVKRNIVDVVVVTLFHWLIMEQSTSLLLVQFDVWFLFIGLSVILLFHMADSTPSEDGGVRRNSRSMNLLSKLRLLMPPLDNWPCWSLPSSDSRGRSPPRQNRYNPIRLVDDCWNMYALYIHTGFINAGSNCVKLLGFCVNDVRRLEMLLKIKLTFVTFNNLRIERKSV